MKNNIAIIIIIILVLGVGGFLVFRSSSGGLGSTVSNGSQLQVSEPAKITGTFKRGQKVPDVSFTDFDGNTHNLSDYAGKAIVLDFWAAWCPFCLEEMPELQKAQDKYGDELVLIGVHRTDTESASRGLGFAQDRGVTYLLVTDPSDSLYRAAGGIGMPTAVFIGKDGVVTEIRSGPKTKEEIEEKIGALVEGS